MSAGSVANFPEIFPESEILNINFGPSRSGESSLETDESPLVPSVPLPPILIPGPDSGADGSADGADGSADGTDTSDGSDGSTDESADSDGALGSDSDSNNLSNNIDAAEQVEDNTGFVTETDVPDNTGIPSESTDGQRELLPNEGFAPDPWFITPGNGGSTTSTNTPTTPTTPVTPPTPIDPGDFEVTYVDVDITCYPGRRTIIQDFLSMDNPAGNGNVFATTTIEANGSGDPAIEDNFTVGDADIWFFTTSVDSTSLSEIPATSNYGSLANWYDGDATDGGIQAMQVELSAGTLSVVQDKTGPYTIPEGEQRKLTIIADCGTNMNVGETSIIRVTLYAED